jgi:hypothetical protein
MTVAQQVMGDLLVQGNIIMTGALTPGVARSTITQDIGTYAVPWTFWRVWDAITTSLPSAGAADDLGLIGGTFGTDVPSLQTGDVKTLTTTRYARCQIRLPPEYQAGAAVTIRCHAGMKTTVAGTSATLDLEVYRSGKELVVSGSDLYAGAAQSINSTTLADKDFPLTATSLLPGDMLDIRLAIATVDGATGTAVIGVVGAMELLCGIKG